MTDKELEKAKTEKIIEIKYASNSSVIFEILKNTGFDVDKNLLAESSKNEIANSFSNIQISKNIKNPEHADLIFTFGDDIILKVNNWSTDSGIDEFKSFIQIIAENKDSLILGKFFGKERMQLEDKIENKIGIDTLSKIDHCIFKKNQKLAFLFEDFNFPDLTEDEIESLKIEMIFLKGSRFKMGDPAISNRRILVNDFSLSKIPVTQEQYIKVMGDDMSEFYGRKNPVENISWDEAIIFCNRLSELFKKTPCYSVNGIFESNDLADLRRKMTSKEFSEKVRCSNTGGFRLPTETEYEYAMKGGINQDEFKFSGSDKLSEVAWTKDNANGKTHEVALKKPNSLGIFDLTGNVYEWCWDWFENFKTKKSDRLKKGGSFNLSNEEYFLNTTYSRAEPTDRSNEIGFRIAITNL